MTFVETIKDGFSQLMRALYPNMAGRFSYRLLYESLFPMLALLAAMAVLGLILLPFKKLRRYWFVPCTVAVIAFWRWG